MQRPIIYPAENLRSSDFLNTALAAMISDGVLSSTLLGSSTVVSGFNFIPTSPASLKFSIGQGAIVSPQVVDQTAYGSIPANSASLTKLGINLNSTPFTLTAPATAGQSITYLVQVSFLEQDVSPVVLGYYNSTNPQQPYSGPGNTGTAQNTLREQIASLEIKAGAAGNTGSQQIPTADAGWEPLWLVTVNYGQTTVTSANVATAPGAPFIANGTLLGGRLVGYQLVLNSQTVVVPAGVRMVRIRQVGAGAGGLHCQTQGTTGALTYASGGGGGAGGYAEWLYAVATGDKIIITVGAAGGSDASGGNTTVTIGSTSVTAGGGQVAVWNGPNSCAGGQGGAVTYSGSPEILAATGGGWGGDGMTAQFIFPGCGGASYFGGGGRAGLGAKPNGTSQSNSAGEAALAYGAGGGAAYSPVLESATFYYGGNGGTGCAICELLG